MSDVTDKGSKADTEEFITVREALRVVDLFSFDSNFVTIVIEKSMQ